MYSAIFVFSIMLLTAVTVVVYTVDCGLYNFKFNSTPLSMC